MSLPAESETETPRSRFPVSPSTAVTIVLLLIAAVLGVLWLIPSNYYLLMPGDALPVERMISVKGYPPPPQRGHLYMTDVNIYPAHHLIEQLYGRLQSHVEMVPIKELSGGLSDNQYFQLNAQLMTNSIQDAEAAALTAAGYHVHFSTAGPEIIFVEPNTPAAAVIRQHDVVKAIDGHRTRQAGDVAPLVRRTKPGRVLHLLIQREHRLLHIDVRTVPSTNGVPDKHGQTALIGIYVQDVLVLPVKVSINAGNIGGPSAGLMFSLGIVERVKHRDLTHGCKVAGTGTIDALGNVGPIGGAQQKIVAAERVGARYFFVPNVRDHDNLLGALSARDGITVVPVKTLNQALRYLDNLSPCK